MRCYGYRREWLRSFIILSVSLSIISIYGANTELQVKPHDPTYQDLVDSGSGVILMCCHMLELSRISKGCQDLKYSWSGPRVIPGFNQPSLHLPHSPNTKREDYACKVTTADASSTADVYFSVEYTEPDTNEKNTVKINVYIFYLLIIGVGLLVIQTIVICVLSAWWMKTKVNQIEDGEVSPTVTRTQQHTESFALSHASRPTLSALPALPASRTLVPESERSTSASVAGYAKPTKEKKEKKEKKGKKEKKNKKDKKRNKRGSNFEDGSEI